MGSRTLTEGEVPLAKQMYGNTISYDVVTINDHKYSILQKDNTAVAPNGSIYYPSGHPYYSTDFSTGNWAQKSNFIHEMGHVLQHQHGMNIVLQRILDGGNYNYDAIFHGTAFHELPMEAQAEFLQGLFLKRNGQPINPNKGGGTLEDSDRDVGEYEDVVPMDLPGPHGDTDPLSDLGEPYIPIPALLPDWSPQTTIPHAGSQAVGSPLVIDVDGDGVELAALNRTGAVYWDIDQDGFREASGWIAGLAISHFAVGSAST